MDLLGVGIEARMDEGRAESNLISTHFSLSNWVLELTLSAVPLRKTLFWKTLGVELNGSQCTV